MHEEIRRLAELQRMMKLADEHRAMAEQARQAYLVAERAKLDVLEQWRKTMEPLQKLNSDLEASLAPIRAARNAVVHQQATLADLKRFEPELSEARRTLAHLNEVVRQAQESAALADAARELARMQMDAERTAREIQELRRLLDASKESGG